MKDFRGNELFVGDHVVFTDREGADLREGIILRFTKQRVEVLYTYSGFLDSLEESEKEYLDTGLIPRHCSTRLKDPKQICKINNGA